MFVVRKEQCVECGAAFSISLEEFIYKLDNGMKLPKRCKDCRRKTVITQTLTAEYVRSCANTPPQKDTAAKYTAVPFNIERRSL